ncbi:MAG: biotin/lipoyl-binding protein [Bacteroidetes bacterium]|nr:biotin/lipoyl-binding protein [Bacteroidota bacterium]
MYKVNVDNKFQFQLEKTKGVWQLNNQDITFDLSELSKTSFHILKDNQSFNVEIVHQNVSEKTFQIKVNNTLYTVSVKDKYDELLRQLGLDKAMTAKVANIKAPMPGLVLNVLVQEGQEIKKGDALLVLEAMKMENILKASTDGLVKKVLAKKGTAVEKGQVLIEF